MMTYPLFIVGAIVLLLLSSVKILNEYERGVVFRGGCGKGIDACDAVPQ